MKNNIITITSNSPEKTKEIGRRIGKSLQGGEIILLYGELGAGKTCLSQGIINGIGNSNDYLRSPTFSIINQHAGRFPIYHVDLYRLEKREDMFETGVEELINSKKTVVIEWGERIEYLDIPDKIEIRINDLGKDRREIKVTGAPEYMTNIFKGR